MTRPSKTSLTPRLRFPEFREAGAWNAHQVGEYLTESRIKGSTGEKARKVTVKLWGKGVFEKQETTKGSANTQYYKRSAGQFIYSKLDFLNQAFGVIPKELDGFESTVDLPCFDVSDELNAEFFREYVQRPSFYKKMGEIADGGRKARRIQVEMFLSFVVSLPTPAEQQKIAACLGSLDAWIAAEGRKLAALRAHKQGLMQQLFPPPGQTQPRRRFPEFQDKAEWRVSTLGDLFETTTGGTPDRSTKAYWNGDIPWVTTSLVDFNVIKSAEEFISQAGLDNSSAKIFPEKTLLMALYGQGKTRGKVALLGIEAATNQACGAILPNDAIDPWFVFLNLGSRYEEIRGISNSGGQKNLSQSLIRELTFSYPDDDEQRAVVGCLSTLDAQITAQAAKIDALATHKRGLMQQLFPAPTED